MSGLFGQISRNTIDKKNIRLLANHIRRRGDEYGSLLYFKDDIYKIIKSDKSIIKVLRHNKWTKSKIVFGQTNMLTDSINSDLPTINGDIILLNDGIVVDNNKLRNNLEVEKVTDNNSDVILEGVNKYLIEQTDLTKLPQYILSACEGSFSGVILLLNLGKAVLFSNNGGLYYGKINDDIYFASEKYILEKLDCKEIDKINETGVIFDLPASNKIESKDEIFHSQKYNMISKNTNNDIYERNMLQYETPNLKRCTACLLPDTFPHISFDSNGVCNYCNNYEKKENKKDKNYLLKLLEPYRKNGSLDCIVPFSGGRDSCYALHLIVNELKLKPITYTYDWGMVTNLASRNISRMCSKLGIENIFVAANINKKRNNIRMNLKAWLKKPHLGMISLLTAGDKHFFKYVETIKEETGIKLNLWGFNHLETTHFKTGFLGLKPDFEEKKVYSTGFRKQMKYQRKRLKQVIKNPRYLNKSIYDTLSGEYYRSIHKKKDYFQIFDYFSWDEDHINSVLETYGFEKANDTNTTWRIGDGTAAFYNYVYYTVAGFTEHDTFRSNQIREGQLSRDEALKLVHDENKPRYENIKWYLDTLNMDYSKVIKVINSIPKLYNINNKTGEK